MATADSTHPRRPRSGIFVVVLLAAIFFILLFMLVFSGGRDDDGGEVQSETLTVLPPAIRLRTEPNVKAPVVATANAGEKLEKIEDRNTWVRVKNADGVEGWAERSALERTAERERRMSRIAAIRKLPILRGVVKENTTLYSGPGIYYPIIGELRAQSQVQIHTRDHDFFAIAHGDEIAYADIDHVDVLAGGPRYAVRSTQTETPVPAPPETAETLEEEEEEMPPAEEPAPPAVAVETDPSGVYSAVPPGGTPPTEIERTSPRYPPAARAAGVQGLVVIRGIVRKDGRIDNVEVLRDLPFGLGEEARRAVAGWRFRPATYRGEPIDVYYTVSVNFRLR